MSLKSRKPEVHQLVKKAIAKLFDVDKSLARFTANDQPEINIERIEAAKAEKVQACSEITLLSARRFYQWQHKKIRR